jgi:hypothetical protein
MVKTNTQLGESDTSVGSTSYLPKTASRAMYARIDWTKPVEEQIAVIGESYELYRPRLNQVIQGKTNSAQGNAKAGGALAFMTMSKEQLKARKDPKPGINRSGSDGRWMRERLDDAASLLHGVERKSG